MTEIERLAKAAASQDPSCCGWETVPCESECYCVKQVRAILRELGSPYFIRVLTLALLEDVRDQEAHGDEVHYDISMRAAIDHILEAD